MLFSHLSAYKNIIWDWNGTLLDDVEITLECLNHQLVVIGQPPMELNEMRRKFHFPVESFYRSLSFPQKEGSYDYLHQIYHALYKEKLATLSLFEGRQTLLATLQQQGVTQYVLSAAPQEPLEKLLHHFEIAPFFSGIYGQSHHRADSKVATGHRLLEIHQLSAKDTILVGDTDHDLEVGQQLNVDVLLLGDGHQHPEHLQRIHHTVMVGV
jgi:phosphoglycolate phosphatase